MCNRLKLVEFDQFKGNTLRLSPQSAINPNNPPNKQGGTMSTKQKIKKTENLVSVEIIQNKIYLIRGQKVMLDRDLAELYGVLTKNFNKSVTRNLDRFPADFAFRLTSEEYENLRFQIGTSSWGGRRYLPYVFTEQGVAMLSSVLRSKRAVQVNIQIMRVFVKIKELMMTHKDLANKIEALEKGFQEKYKEQDNKIITIFNAIRQIMSCPEPKAPYKRTKVGFIVDKEEAK